MSFLSTELQIPEQSYLAVILPNQWSFTITLWMQVKENKIFPKNAI